MSDLIPGLGFKKKYSRYSDYSHFHRFLVTGLISAWLIITFQAAAADVSDEDEDDQEPELQMSYHHERLSGFFDDFEAREDEHQSELEIELAYPFQISPSVELFLTTTAVYERNREPGKSRWKTNDFIELNELWVEWEPDLNPSTKFRLGRQSIADQRGWWWDEEFDAITHSQHYQNSGFSWSLGRLAETEIGLDHDDPEEDDLYWLMLHMKYQDRRFGSVAGYITRLDDRSSTFAPDQIITEQEIDEADATLNWIGIRYNNSWTYTALGELSVLLDLAYMKGKETQIEVDEEEEEPPVVSEVEKVNLQGRSSHLEIGWQPNFAEGLELGLLYAKGSADYRQTGVHSNESDHHYYGALYDPSLQNIQITGIHASLEILEEGKLIIHYLDYSRPKVENDPGDNSIDLDAEAERRDLGTEVGLIYAQEIVEDVELELTISQFRSGKAYAEFSDRKFNWVEVELSYSF